MAAYELTWITDHLAAGSAPMSHDDLNHIASQGIGAIVNLCAEYCDLHEIEMQSGFSVQYLPIVDECAPESAPLESALAWVDEMVDSGKKVLVHCRFGIGRTGTFVSTYLLRRGMLLKEVNRRLKKTRAQPANFCQCRFVKRYARQWLKKERNGNRPT